MICITISGDQNTTMYDEKSGKICRFRLLLSLNWFLFFLKVNFLVTQKERSHLSFSKLLSKRMETLIKQAGEGADVSALYKKASKEVVIRFGLSSGLSSASQKTNDF